MSQVRSVASSFDFGFNIQFLILRHKKCSYGMKLKLESHLKKNVRATAIAEPKGVPLESVEGAPSRRLSFFSNFYSTLILKRSSQFLTKLCENGNCFDPTMN